MFRVPIVADQTRPEHGSQGARAMTTFPAAATPSRNPDAAMTDSHATTPALQKFLTAVAQRARQADVFAAVNVHAQAVVCDAKASAAPAQYRLTIEKQHVYVELTTADRWLSHSIEADLLNTGDKLEELIDEELVELGGSAIHARVEHFRNDAKRFVFRSRLPLGESASTPLGDASSVEIASRALLAYESCFAALGDMSSPGEE